MKNNKSDLMTSEHNWLSHRNNNSMYKYSVRKKEQRQSGANRDYL